MDSQNRSSHLERNPKTYAEHRRETLLQITLPLLFGLLVILAGVGAIIYSTVQPVTDVGRWASVSLMWLILPSLLIALLFLVLLAAFIFVTSYIMHFIPHYALVIQLYLEKIRNKIRQLADMGIEPILRISVLWAAIRYATGRGKKPLQE